MSQSGILNVGSGSVPSNVAQAYVTDAGTAVPSANVLNVLGTNGITTQGVGNTLTIIGSSNTTPNQVLRLAFDFLNQDVYESAWDSDGTQVYLSGTATNPGLVQVGTPSGFGGTGFFLARAQAPASYSFVVGGGTLSVNYVISLVTLSTVPNPYIFWVGLGDVNINLPTPYTTPDNGIFFTYTNSVSGGNWVANCVNATTITSTDTGVAAGTGFVNLGFVVNPAGTSVTFNINHVNVATINTNIPTAAVAPFIQWVDQPGYVLPNLPASLVDLFYLTYALTTPR